MYFIIICILFVCIIILTNKNRNKVSSLQAMDDPPIIVPDLSMFSNSEIINRANMIILETFLNRNIDNVAFIDIDEQILSMPGIKEVVIHYTNGKYEKVKVCEQLTKFSLSTAQSVAETQEKESQKEPIKCSVRETVEQWIIKNNALLEQIEKKASDEDKEIYLIPAKVIGDDPDFVKELSLALSDRGHLFVQPDDSGILLDVLK